jgi:hypothetical protein
MRVRYANTGAHCAGLMSPSFRSSQLRSNTACFGMSWLPCLQAVRRASRWSPLRAAWLGALACAFPGVNAGRVGAEPVLTHTLHAGGGQGSGSGSGGEAGTDQRRVRRRVDSGPAAAPPGHSAASDPASPSRADCV